MQGTAGGRLGAPIFLHNTGYSSGKSSISLLNANKHLMTDPERNSYFLFSENVNVSRGGAEENVEIRVKQN